MPLAAWAVKPRLTLVYPIQPHQDGCQSTPDDDGLALVRYLFAVVGLPVLEVVREPLPLGTFMGAEGFSLDR